MRTTALLLGACGFAVAASAGCSPIVGLDGYSARADVSDGGPSPGTDASDDGPGTSSGQTADGPDTASDAGAADSATCDVDLTTQCYACSPIETVQFLNACTNATCVPFDDSARLTRLFPDGGLPPLPSGDAGTQ